MSNELKVLESVVATGREMLIIAGTCMCVIDTDPGYSLQDKSKLVVKTALLIFSH